MEHPLPALSKHVTASRSQMVRMLRRARRKIESRVSDPPRNFATSAAVRRRVEREINSVYTALAFEIDSWAAELTEDTAKTFRGIARKDIAEGGGRVTQFRRELVERYASVIGMPQEAVHKAPQERKINGQTVELPIAAARTNQMARSDILQLRGVVSNVILEANVTARTAKELQRDVEAAVTGTARQLDSWQFIDRAGRAWKNSNYFNMLTRTIPALVAREAYSDALIEAGEEWAADLVEEGEIEKGSPEWQEARLRYDLATIQGGGQPCPICARWQGVIVSISGGDKRFPSRQDALDAGVWHPNCVDELVYVDRDLEADEIDQQAGLPNPGDPTPEEWNNYAEEIQQQAKDRVRVQSKSVAMRRDPEGEAAKEQRAAGLRELKEAGSIEQAEEIAREMIGEGKGVRYKGLSVSDANEVNRGLNDALAAGWDMPNEIEVTSESWSRIDKGKPEWMGTDGGRLLIREGSPFFDPNSKESKQAKAAGWFLDHSVAGSTRHELAHIRHSKMFEARKDWARHGRNWSGVPRTVAPDDPDSIMRKPNPKYREIIEQVSEYAGTNNAEFVAEVGSGLLAGRTFSAEVMDAFKKALGVDAEW